MARYTITVETTGNFSEVVFERIRKISEQCKTASTAWDNTSVTGQDSPSSPAYPLLPSYSSYVSKHSKPPFK